MTPADRPLNVVVFGSYDVSRHPRVAVLRDGLAATGHAVTEINRPLGMSTADKVRAAGSLSGALRLAVSVVRSWVWLYRAARRHPGVPDLVVVGYLGHFDVHLARLVWPSARIALDHLVGLADTARDRGLAGGPKYWLLDRVDRAALGRSDIVVVDTEEQLEQLPEALRQRAVVVPVGATEDWFTPGSVPAPPPLRVCFVGLYTPLQGTPVIGRAISMLAGDDRFRFTMVGSGQDLDRTRSAAGAAPVEWIDWIPSEDLPQLVASQHVCLGIFGTSDKARRVVPNKVYQGLAAGNVVVTSDTPPQRRALGDAAFYVAPGDAQALAECLRKLADTLSADGTGWGALADRFRPERVVEPLLERVGSTRSKRNLAAGPALPANAWLRFDVLRAPLERLDPCRVLEIGPGRGAIAARMVAAGHDYTGVEMADEARAATERVVSAVSGGHHRLVASIDDLGAGERFGLVYAFEVLEHIEDDAGALAQWTARLEPGGQLLLSVPAFQRMYSSHDVEVGHLRRYEPEELQRLAEAAGLVEVEVTVYGFGLGPVLQAARNTVSRLVQRRGRVEDESPLERTKRSGGWYQPPDSMNRVVQAATWPFRVLQRSVTDRGTGLVLSARAPSDR
jgi:glycosyltransferase involved in cell wall biosynthesis